MISIKGEAACLSEVGKKLECIFCDVQLIFNEEHGFYRCPDCGGEWWPDPSNYDVITLWRDEQVYKKTMSKLGGGSSSSGRKKDKKKRPKQPWLNET